MTINSIQSLRAIAALMVVFVHVSYNAGGYSADPAIARIGYPGGLGVDIFFAISGFIMYVVVCAKDVGPGFFIIDRITRIYPLYIGCNLTLLALALMGSSVERPSAYHFVMSLMLLPHSSGDGVHPFLDVGWTLVYEMFFYAVLATSLLVRPFHVQTLVIALVLFVMAGLIFDPQLRALKTYSNPILLEFLSGVLLGVLWKSDVKAPAWAGLIIVVLAVTSIFSFWTGEEVGLHRFVFWGVPCAAIVAGFLCMENLAIFRSRVSLLLGASSYSIYLTHTLILLVLGRIWKLMGTPSLPVLIVVPVIMAILVGVGCHLLVEIPMTRFLRDLIQTRRRAAAFGLRS